MADELEEVHYRQINVTQVENTKLSQHENSHKHRPSFQKDLDGFTIIFVCFIVASAWNLPRSPFVTIFGMGASSII